MSSYRDYPDPRDRDRDYRDRDNDRAPSMQRPESYHPNYFARRNSSFSDRDRDRDERPPLRRQESAQSPASYSSPLTSHISSPRHDPVPERRERSISHTKEYALTAQEPAKVPILHTPKPSQAPSQQSRDITNVLNTLCDRAFWYSQREEATKRLDKLNYQKEKISKSSSDFVSEHLFLQTRYKEAEALKKKCNSRIVAQDTQAQQELLLFFEKHQRSPDTGALDERVRALEASLSKKLEDKMKEHQAKESELVHRLKEQTARNKTLEDKLEKLFLQVNEANNGRSELVKEVAQLKQKTNDPLFMPVVNQMKEKLEEQEPRIAILKPLQETVEAQRQEIAKPKLQRQTVGMENKKQQATGVQLLCGEVETLEQQASGLTPLRDAQGQQTESLESLRKIDSHAQKITDLESRDAAEATQQITDLDSLREVVASQGQQIADLKSRREMTEPQALPDLESLRSKVDTQEQQILNLKALRETMDFLRSMIKEVIGDIKSVENKVSNQEQVIGSINDKVKMVEVKHAAIENTKPPLPLSLSNPRLSPSGGSDLGPNVGARSETLDTTNNSQEQILGIVETRLKENDAQAKRRFEWLSIKIGQMIDREGTKREELEKWAMATLDKQTTSVELEDVSRLANRLKTDIESLQTALAESKKLLYRKGDEDHKIFEDLALRIHHLNLWRDNFSTAELARSMVAHIAHSIPQGMQEQLRHLGERVTKIEGLVYHGGYDTAKKRKISTFTPAPAKNSPMATHQ